MKKFILQNWRSFVISLIASLLATGIVALILVNILRVPNFELVTKYTSIQNQTSSEKYGKLEFRIKNKKRYVGFSREEVTFFLAMPSNLLEDKELFAGNQRVDLDKSEIQKFTIEAIDYSLLKSVIKLPVHPKSTTNFLKLKGTFEFLSYGPIYYAFGTPFGFFPSFFESRADMPLSKTMKLPSHMIYIEE